MAKRKRVIRKLGRPTDGFDEQIWPVLFALVVLCGFITGTILAYLRLDDARWYANAWTWLIAVPICLAAAAVWLHFYAHRLMRRTMQFALILCLIVHVVLFLVALRVEVFEQIWSEIVVSVDTPPEDERIKVPVYHQFPQQPTPTKKDFEKPVPTPTPEPEPEPDPVPREEPEPEPDPAPPRPTPVPEVDREVETQLSERATTADTVPRRSRQSGKLSRRPTQSVVRPQPAIAAPQIAAQAPQRPQSVAARVTPQERAATSRQASERAPTNDPQSNRPRPELQVRRSQAAARPDAQPSSRPTLPRRLAQPSSVPTVEIPSSEAPTVSRTNDAQAMAPANTLTRKRATATPQTDRTPPTVTPETPSRTAVQVRRQQQPSTASPELARSRQAVPNQRRRLTTRPDVASSVQAPPASSQPDSSATARLEARSSRVSRVEPSSAAVDGQTTAPSPPESRPAVARSSTPRARPEASQVAPKTRVATAARRSRSNVSRAAETTASAEGPSPPRVADGTAGRAAPAALATTRQTTSGVAASRPRAELQPAVAQAGASSEARPDGRASRRSQAPSLSGEQQAPTRPRRAVHAASLATSPAGPENPALARSSRPSATPDSRPSATAISRLSTGVAGAGEGRNLDRALPAAESPAMMASGAARRREASQQTPRGPALSPSTQAALPRRRAGRQRPSAVAKADPLATQATRPGATSPSQLNANAAASVAKASAEARSGPVTAARGTAEVDLGPTKLVSENQTGRAAGGGQPEPNFEPPAQRPQRQAGGGSPSLSLAAENAEAEVAAPAGDQSPASALAARSASMGRGAANPEALPAEATTVAELDQGATLNAAGDNQAPRATSAYGSDAPSQEAAPPGRLARTLPAAEAGSRLTGPTVPAAGPTMASAAESTDPQAPAASALSVARAGGKSASEPAAGGAAREAPVGSLTNPTLVGNVPARAEAAESTAGPPMPGGGSGQPKRNASGPRPLAETRADTVSLAGRPASAGKPSGAMVRAQAIDPSKTAGGAAGPTRADPVGADIASAVNDFRGARPAGIPGTRQGQASDSQLERAEQQAQDRGAPGKQRPRTEIASSTQVSPAALAPADDSRVPATMTDAAAGALALGPLTRASPAALPVGLDAPRGPGGLGDEASVEVGIDSRRARDESLQVEVRDARFVKKDVGGQPRLNTSASVASEPFRRRMQRESGRGQPVAGQPSMLTEEAIELGLVFLSRCQQPDGSWTLGKFDRQDGTTQLASDTAATGLALLAFQGAGYYHTGSGKYAGLLQGGVQYLVSNQRADGDLFVEMDAESNRVVRFYSHSIAALALSEAYGMTQDAGIRDAAQKALDFIVRTQHAERGGWRYSPNRSSDTSVTGWMMLALKSGELAGLSVPPETYDGIRKWLDAAQSSPSDAHLYRYNPFAADSSTQRQGREISKTMTAVGLLTRLYLGWRRDNVHLRRGSEYLSQYPPQIGTPQAPLRDTYYWYYATQVMFHMGGEHWKNWNDHLHPILTESQVQEGPMAGSWQPRGAVPDRWAPHGGRLYVTAMNLLSLEVFYRHLPLYEETAR